MFYLLNEKEGVNNAILEKVCNNMILIQNIIR